LKKFKEIAKSVERKQRIYITKVKEEKTYLHNKLLWRYAEIATPESTTILRGQEN
jgi:hypothetical protein